jgi:hypothetical protein
MENLEQLEAGTTDNSECPPVAADGSKSVDAPRTENYGKFANIEELLSSYRNLEAEFTRKSQLLSQIQQGKVSVTDSEKPVTTAAKETTPETAAAKSVVSVTNEADRDEIIKEYLTSVAAKQHAPAVITTSNEFVFGVKTQVKSLREVSALAENFFKNKES